MTTLKRIAIDGRSRSVLPSRPSPLPRRATRPGPRPRRRPRGRHPRRPRPPQVRHHARHRLHRPGPAPDPQDDEQGQGADPAPLDLPLRHRRQPADQALRRVLDAPLPDLLGDEVHPLRLPAADDRHARGHPRPDDRRPEALLRLGLPGGGRPGAHRHAGRQAPHPPPQMELPRRPRASASRSSSCSSSSAARPSFTRPRRTVNPSPCRSTTTSTPSTATRSVSSRRFSTTSSTSCPSF